MFISYKDAWRNHQLALINLIMLYEDEDDSRVYYNIIKLLSFYLLLKIS